MNLKGNVLIGVIVGIVVLGIIGFSWYIGGYNKAIALDEGVTSLWAQVDSQLQRRNDLIPNLDGRNVINPTVQDTNAVGNTLSPFFWTGLVRIY